MPTLRCFSCDWGYSVPENSLEQTAKEHLLQCDGPVVALLPEKLADQNVFVFQPFCRKNVSIFYRSPVTLKK